MSQVPDDIVNDMGGACEPANEDRRSQSVRDDIIAELQDHLLCAAVRESLADPALAQPQTDSGLLWQRVVDRFGSPVQIARQLWWAANWEFIMSQRITLGLIIVLVLTSLGMGLLLSKSVAINRDAFAQLQSTVLEGQRQQTEIMTEVSAMLSEQAAQATKAAQAVQANRPPSEWNQLTVALEYAPPASGPVADARIQVAGISANASALPMADLPTGPDGKVDFGKVLFGDYLMEVALANGAKLTRRFSVHPGRDQHLTLQCPDVADTEAELKIIEPELPAEFALPEEIEKRVWQGVSLSFESVFSFANNLGAIEKSSQQSKAQLEEWYSSHEAPHLVLLYSPEGEWFSITPESGFVKGSQEIRVEDRRFIFDREDRGFIIDRNEGPGRRRYGQVELLAVPQREQLIQGLRLPLGRIRPRQAATTYLAVEGVDGQHYLMPIVDQVPRIIGQFVRVQEHPINNISTFFPTARNKTSPAPFETTLSRPHQRFTSTYHVDPKVRLALSVLARLEPGSRLFATFARRLAGDMPSLPGLVDIQVRPVRSSRPGESAIPQESEFQTACSNVRLWSILDFSQIVPEPGRNSSFIGSNFGFGLLFSAPQDFEVRSAMALDVGDEARIIPHSVQN